MRSDDMLGPISVVPRGALRHEVMRRLLRAIFEGKLPAGTRLMVLKLAQSFGTSSTPVREALVELDAMGVVEFIHNRGVVVAPFGPKELRDLYQIRGILEAEATRCACGHVDPGDLAALGRQTAALLDGQDQPLWLESAVAADRRLHELVANCCGNARLTKEIRRYDTLVQTIREIIGDDRQAQERAIREHQEVIGCLMVGDGLGASQAMARHITSAAQTAESVLFGGR